MTNTTAHTSSSTTTATLSQSAQAQMLADRLEQGARALYEFASGLTDAEWRMRVPHDGRTVGVTVHHVAFVYPIEIDIAVNIGNGNVMTGLTMDDIHALNAKHAADNADISQDAALAFLKQNSAAAAAAIRSLTDEQLATARPASLYADAPVTCQFVLEDHAVRHSYHHLARLRRTIASR